MVILFMNEQIEFQKNAKCQFEGIHTTQLGRRENISEVTITHSQIIEHLGSHEETSGNHIAPVTIGEEKGVS